MKAGIETLPCWVEEMDDDTAYMELVKANNQGELLALEIGIHALAMVGKAQGKKTKGDGLAGYAEEIGKSRPLLTQWVDAAKVHQDLDSKMSYYLNEKTSHLYEISKADSCTWQVLADLLIECDWTVKDTQAAVNRIKSIVLLDWMQPLDGFYREVATVPAYAKNTETAIKEINSCLEKLAIVTLYQLKDSGITEIRDGFEYRRFDPIAYQFNQKKDFIREIKDSGQYFDVAYVRGLYKEIISDCQKKSSCKVSYERVLSDEEVLAISTPCRLNSIQS
jgi:hypothetical protein